MVNDFAICTTAVMLVVLQFGKLHHCRDVSTVDFDGRFLLYLYCLTTVKGFTFNRCPILKPEQLMTPDKRICFVAESWYRQSSAELVILGFVTCS